MPILVSSFCSTSQIFFRSTEFLTEFRFQSCIRENWHHETQKNQYLFIESKKYIAGKGNQVRGVGRRKVKGVELEEVQGCGIGLGVGLEQACTTYGPRDKCGPQKLLIWPAKPQILFILLLSLAKTPYECVKTYQLWPSMRFELCNSALEDWSFS